MWLTSKFVLMCKLLHVLSVRIQCFNLNITEASKHASAIDQHSYCIHVNSMTVKSVKNQ